MHLKFGGNSEPRHNDRNDYTQRPKQLHTTTETITHNDRNNYTQRPKRLQYS